MRRKPTTKTLKRKLSDRFRKMIHARDAELPCISCGKFVSYKQAGHFVKCDILSTRWHPWNVNGECVSCNCMNQTHLTGYTINLGRRIGPDTVESLCKLARVRWKPLPDQLERLILACDSPEDYESEWFAVQKEFAPND